jgi:hypothetical protein
MSTSCKPVQDFIKHADVTHFCPAAVAGVQIPVFRARSVDSVDTPRTATCYLDEDVSAHN